MDIHELGTEVNTQQHNVQTDSSFTSGSIIIPIYTWVALELQMQDKRTNHISILIVWGFMHGPTFACIELPLMASLLTVCERF